jgi:hypothetical protein
MNEFIDVILGAHRALGTQSNTTYMYTHVPDIRPSEYGSNKLLAPCPAPHEEEDYQKRFLRHAGFK